MNKRRRILILAHGLMYGGAQVATIEFLKLIKDVLDIHVVVSRNANVEFICDLRALDVEISSVPCRIISGYPDMEISAIANMVNKADCVWISDVEYMAAPKIKRLKNLPVIAHLHNYALLCPYWVAYYGLKQICLEPCNAWRIVKCRQMTIGERQKLGILPYLKAQNYKLLYGIWGPMKYIWWYIRRKRIIHYIDGFIAPSRAVGELYEQHVPELKRKQIEVIPNPIEIPCETVQQFIREEERELSCANVPKITYVDAAGGNVNKGPHILLQALKVLKNSGLRFEANMIGCKGTWVEKYALKLGIAKEVNFYGRLPKREVYHLMGSSSAVAVPSIWPEPFGIVALEANYLGVPVVASRTGGLSEIIVDGVTGLLVSPGDPKALAESIMMVLDRQFSRWKIHRITASRFNSNDIKKCFIKFLANIA